MHYSSSKEFPNCREAVGKETFAILIKPSWLINLKLLPKALYNRCKNEISPTMNLIEGAPEIQINLYRMIDGILWAYFE